MKDESGAQASAAEEGAASHPSSFSSFAAGIEQLTRTIEALAPGAARLGVGPPQGREWFDLLQRKLLPQLQGPPLLIVAIVGGTNIGKSVVFNHLAGETASAATPLAAGTKHPVCLVPPGCDDPQLLGRLFEHFELHAWQSADDPLCDSPADRIYWRVGSQVPQRLVLVDAPDVDSDATVNWQRARAVRQTADVLIALLTQQKYNDAAVKQFFRAAVEADKPIIVIFNFCDLEADRDYWPQWLARFCAETGATPELVYVVPYDRAAASELRLPFYRLEGRMRDERLGMRDEGQRQDALAEADSSCHLAEIGETASDPSSFTLHPSSFILHPSSSIPPPSSPTDLRNELAALHFGAIKIRTFRGALGACSIRPRACRLTCTRSAPRPGSSPRRQPHYLQPRWRESPGPACPPRCWSMKCSSGGMPIERPGRGGSTASIAWSVGASCGRCGRPGPRWPVPAKIRSRPFSGRSRQPW